MKRIICLALGAAMLFASRAPAKAAVGVELGLALKCIAIGIIIPTAIIIYKCDRDFYLVKYEPEGEVPWWEASKANKTTLAKLGGLRCEGPFKDAQEPADRAWANNRQPDNPPFPCGPLGTIPGPNTNALRAVLQMSGDGGASWNTIASATNDPGDNLSFAVLLSPAGTNGMTAEQILQVRDCDVMVNAPTTTSSALFRVLGD